MKTKTNGHATSMLEQFLDALGKHEAREIERHAEVLRRLDQTRETFLRGRQQADRLEARVKVLEDWKKSIEEHSA